MNGICTCRGADDEWSSDWEGVPRTDLNASIVCKKMVSGAAVIKLSKASIRNAEILDCCFELAAPGSAPRVQWGANRVEVKCLWYRRKPRTSWMHIIVLGEYQIIENFNGEVVWNISRE